MKFFLWLPAIFIVSAAIAQSRDFPKAKAIINEYVNNKQFPSISIAVVKDGKIIWEESFGYADKEAGRKATPHTPYYTASITKTMTATALMKMAEQKMISIDSPVNKYLRRTKISSYLWDAHKATLKAVMSHTSGITTFNFWCRTDSLTCASLDDEVMKRYAIILSPPGQFDYSNLGYGVLDRVIRDVSGISYAEFMHREIFQPLGLKNTFVAGNPLPPTVAIRYAGKVPERTEFPFSHQYSAGASTAYSSVHDLATFAMLHLNDLKKNRVLSSRSVKAMQDTVARNGDDHYGLGWWITDDYYGYKGLLAQGGTWNAQAWMQLVPSEDIAVVVVGNYGDGSPYRAIINEVLSTLLPEFKANMVTSDAKPKAAAAAESTPEPPSSKWRGVLKTYQGDVPVAFYYNGSATSSADLDTLRNIPLSKVSVSGGQYSYTVKGDLGLEDLGRPPYNLNFYLRQDGDKLYGSVQTSSAVHPDTPTLSFWVEMKSQE
ncbi:MAG: serine hydrolase domain-containing protein [Chryseolinea sp.]